jgi:hypothetical protein
MRSPAFIVATAVRYRSQSDWLGLCMLGFSNISHLLCLKQHHLNPLLALLTCRALRSPATLFRVSEAAFMEKSEVIYKDTNARLHLAPPKSVRVLTSCVMGSVGNSIA